MLFRSISEKGNKFYVRIYKRKKCRACYASNIETAIKIRDKWLLEYSNNPEKWIEETTNKTYKRE